MHIRCPHCQHLMELLQEAELSDVSCPSCGSQFSLVDTGADTLTHQSGDETETISHSLQTRELGHFQLTQRLGAGAFGEVWKATDASLERTVAVKIPRKHRLDPRESESFLREARAAAQLKHPNIVSVHEVGSSDGQIYIVSDFIQGVTLADRLTRGPLSAIEAGRLTVKIARALHHAHEQGIIHRDLKPSNVMLDSGDEPHVMDFGLAKREASEITMTVEGQVLGTPAYMPPEQAAGSGHNADRRSDVYSLGVMLFEMATGERPFRGNVRMLIHQVLEDEPPAPRSLNGAVPIDLNTIILKCLEKDSDRRYSSAEALAEDVQRWLENKPIQARPAGVALRLQKWVARHPAPSALIAVIFLALTTFTVGSLWYQRQLSDSLQNEKAAKTTALTEKNRAVDAEKQARKLAEEKQNLLTLEERARADEQQAKRRLIRNMMNSGLKSLSDASFDEGIHVLALAIQEIAEESQDLKQAAMANLAMWQDKMLSIVSAIDHVTEMRALKFSRDGRFLLSGGLDHAARVWNSYTGEPAGELLEHPHQVESADISHDGEKVLTGCFDGTIRLFDWRTGELLWGPIDTGSLVRDVGFSADDRFSVSRSNNGRVTVLDVATGGSVGSGIPDNLDFTDIAIHPSQQILLALEYKKQAVYGWNIEDGSELFDPLTLEAKPSGVQFSPSGNQFAVITSDDVTIYPAKDPSADPIVLRHRGVSAMAFSSDERLASTASYGGQVVTWHLPEARPVNRPLEFPGQTNYVGYVPGATLIAITAQQQVRLWDPLTNLPVGQLQRDNYKVAFSPDGKLIATGSSDGPIRVWGVKSLISDDRLLPHQNLIMAAEFDPSGELVVTGGQDEAVRLWSTKTGAQIGETLKMPDMISALAFHPGGKRFAVGSSDGTVQLFDSEAAKPVGQQMHHDGRIREVMFSHDGDWLYSAGDDGFVRIFDGSTGEPSGEPLEHRRVVRKLAVNSRHNLLISSIYDGNAILWDLEVRRRRHVLIHGERLAISAVAIHPNGTRALTADNKGRLRIWDTKTGELLRDVAAHEKGITAAHFSHDGMSILTSSYDHSARIWDAETGEPLTPLLQHDSSVLSVAFSPDDRFVLTGSDDDTAQLWHAATGIRVGARIQHRGKIWVAKFSPTGRDFLTAHGTARLCEIPRLDLAPDAVSHWVAAITGISYREDGRLKVLDAPAWRASRQALDEAGEGMADSRLLPLNRLRFSDEGETGPFAQVYRSFSPRPKLKQP